MKKYFPHINRIISARIFNHFYNLFKYLVIGTIIAVTYLNFHTQFFPENEDYVKLKLETIKRVNDPTAYTRLALYLDYNGLERQAYENFRVAQNLFLQTNVLGAQNSPFSVYKQLQEQKKVIANQADYWKEISQQKPDFRDAYLQLGVLLYKLGDYDLAKKALNKAFEIDPFYQNKEVYLNLISKI